MTSLRLMRESSLGRYESVVEEDEGFMEWDSLGVSQKDLGSERRCGSILRVSGSLGEIGGAEVDE